jgi:ABC-type antimicrobial peptide transport system permease subunit
MQTYSSAVLFIGLIFDVLLLIFVVVACLLIYSLLLISVETKTFEIGVMRLVGLSKFGFVGMIMTQSAMFVLPSVIMGFLIALPCIFLVYSMLFTEDLGFKPSILPSPYAST